METFSFTGTLFGDDEAIVDVCLFEDLPFSQVYKIINQWRAGDIMDLIVEEGLLTKEERNLSKITSVRVDRITTKTNSNYSIGGGKATLINEYTVHLGIMTSYINAGRNLKTEDMDQKIRNIKLKRILE